MTTTNNRIEQTSSTASLRMATTPDIGRQTQARDFSARLKAGVDATGQFIGGAASVAGNLVGAPIVSAAISNVGGLGGGAFGGGGMSQSASLGGFGGSTPTSAAFGTALNVGSPGLVQTSVASASGPLSGNLLGGSSIGGGGVSSGLTSTFGSTSSTVGVGGVSTDPFSAISGTTSSAGGYQNYFSSLGQQQYQMLNLQIAMQQEYQFFATLSNVLKTRYDTQKNSISNIR